MDYEIARRIILGRIIRSAQAAGRPCNPRSLTADQDDQLQNGLAHTWVYCQANRDSHPDWDDRECTVKAAVLGAKRITRPIVPREPHYRDAMDYVSPDDDVYHLPSHAGRARRESCELSDEELVETILPEPLQPIARLAIAGLKQSAIARRRGCSRNTVVTRMREIRQAIRDHAADRQPAIGE